MPPEQLYARWHDAVARSRALFGAAIAEGGPARQPKSAHGLSAGIQLTRDGFYLAALEGEDARRWRERHPGRSLPRRRVRTLDQAG